MNSQKGISRKEIIILVICLLAAILSFTAIASYTSSQGFMDPILQSLDEKKQDVLELTAASTGASIGITALPGDIATPIAEKMASISQYLLIVICAIYLEKYLVTVMGFVTFRILIPIGLALLAVGTVVNNRVWHRIAFRLILFGLALFCVIPISVHISDFISDSYKETLEAAVAASSKEEQGADQAPGAQEEKEDKSLWERILDFPEEAAEAAESAMNGASEITKEKINDLQIMLNNFMESVAVMIITSCVIPILVLLFFVYLIFLAVIMPPTTALSPSVTLVPVSSSSIKSETRFVILRFQRPMYSSSGWPLT